ncbi:hypothetical protein [Bacillus sp. MMSF_3328]|uniref:hypothetical protein n=1 Tax=Bacillus sp. MMSF_3328 TaxID=3047080 RepID=UPI00273D41A0|nr:hypothetical protein [Bacillus sp. MMSF_3328]
MKVKNDLFNVFIYLSSGIGFIISLLFYENFANGYEQMIFFPLIFFILYLLFLENLRHSSVPFTAYGIIGMEWIRFVLMPPICATAGDYAGFNYINPSAQSLHLATTLMIYEIFAVAIFCRIFISIKNSNKDVNSSSQISFLKGNRFVYLSFILLALVVFLTIGRNSNLLNFLYIPVNSSERIGDITTTSLVLARQILIIGIFLVFLWTVSYCKRKYEQTFNKLYIYLSLLVALLNVAIIVGERRTAQVYTAVICIWILIRSFPGFKKKIVFSIVSTATVILVLMSIYKFFGAFQYDSYSAALSNSNADISWLSRTLQSYFFGPENVAITLDFFKSIDVGTGNMFYDFLRSTFGVSFLLKGDGVLTSEIFNTYIYGIERPTGHVISAIGYSVLFFGIFLAPIFALFNIFISAKVEKQLYKSKSYEMMYVWGYVLVRFATNLFVNTPPLISNASIMLGTAGLLFFTAFTLKLKKRYGI